MSAEQNKDGIVSIALGFLAQKWAVIRSSLMATPNHGEHHGKPHILHHHAPNVHVLGARVSGLFTPLEVFIGTLADRPRGRGIVDAVLHEHPELKAKLSSKAIQEYIAIFEECRNMERLLVIPSAAIKKFVTWADRYDVSSEQRDKLRPTTSVDFDLQTGKINGPLASAESVHSVQIAFSNDCHPHDFSRVANISTSVIQEPKGNAIV